MGIDLGGSITKIGLVDEHGLLLEKRMQNTRIESGPPAQLDEIVAVVRDLQEFYYEYEIKAVGLGIPGILDEAKTSLTSAANFPGWLDFDLASYLKEKLSLPVSIENDANVAALAERWFGAGVEQKDLFMITLGTGIGSGIIMNNQLHQNGSTSEFGHMIIDIDGAVCTCGRHGCLETFFSKRGLAMALQQMREAYPDSMLYTAPNVSPLEIFVAASARDGLALAVYEQAGKALGTAMANIVNILGVTCFIIGGGVAKAWDYFYPAALHQARVVAFESVRDKISIKKASLGEAAGILGAAVLARQKLHLDFSVSFNL